MKLFRTYKRKLNKTPDFDTYFGTRFEIAIASDLIRRNCVFERVPESQNETPDFMICADPTCYVECASAHLSKPRPKDLEYKIIYAIDDKSKKSYRNHNTALFVDISNILHHALLFKMPIHNRLQEIVDKKTSSSGYGSLVLYTFMFDKQTHGYFLKSLRKDSEEISPALRKFLDIYRPIIVHKVDHFYQPSSG